MQASAINNAARVGVLAAALAGAACSAQREGLSGALSRLPSPADLPLVYKVDVQQGNVIDQDMLAQLEKGMDRDKVRFVMGTPIIEDVFHPDRWDYLYSYKKGSQPREQRHITLFFEDERLAYVTGDIQPADGFLQPELRNDKVVEVPHVERNRTLMQRVTSTIGFGDDDAPEYVDLDDEAQVAAADGEGETPEDEQREDAGDGEPEQAEAESAEPPKEEKKGFFGRLMDRLGGGAPQDDELVHRDPTQDNPLD